MIGGGGGTVICLICRGRGWHLSAVGPAQKPYRITCPDCKGKGRVNHCVACGGQKRLWLGGTDYLDPCPACDGTGMKTTRRRYVVQSGGFLSPAPPEVATVVRNPAKELIG